MGVYGKGTIEIPLEEFWEFVNKYVPDQESNNFFGVPRVNNVNQVLEINYMFNSEISPEDEIVFKESECYKQWQQLKCKDEN